MASKKEILGAILITIIASGGSAITTYLLSPDTQIFLYSDSNQFDTDGIFTLAWIGLECDNYSIYQSPTYITEINESTQLIVIQSSTELMLSYDSGTYYFLVEGDSVLSNCITVQVEIIEFVLTSTETVSSDGDFMIEWMESDNNFNYVIYQDSTDIAEINDELIILGHTNSSTFNISNYEDGIYYFIVQANNLYESIISNCIRVDVERLPKSFNLSATIVNDHGFFNLTWTESEDTANYTIFQSDQLITELNETVIMLGDLNETFFSCILYPKGTFYFRVRANNEFGHTLSNCIKIIV